MADRERKSLLPSPNPPISSSPCPPSERSERTLSRLRSSSCGVCLHLPRGTISCTAFTCGRRLMPVWPMFEPGMSIRTHRSEKSSHGDDHLVGGSASITGQRRSPANVRQKKMKIRGTILALMLPIGFFAGCVGTGIQTLPPIEVECRVVEFPSMKPIPDAVVTWRYVGPSGESKDAGTFVTNGDGICLVSVPEQRLPLQRMDGYFAGGYFREIAIRAPGFDGRAWGETALRERIDHSATRPIEFRLVRKKPTQVPVPPSTSFTPRASSSAEPSAFARPTEDKPEDWSARVARAALAAEH